MTQQNKNRHPIWAIAGREVKRLVSRPLYIFAMIIAPVFSAVFFLTLMEEGLPIELPIAVVDQDNTETSRNLARQLGAFEQVGVVMQCGDFTEARKAMQRGEIYGIFLIPQGFTVEASTGKQPTLSYYTNYSFLIAGSLVYRDMRTMATLAGAAVGLQMGLAKGYTERQIMGQLQPIVVDTHALGNPWLNYSVYLNNVLVPGVLELMIFLVTVFCIGTEIKMGTSREWLRMGNNSLFISLIGKLLPHTIIFSIVGIALCSGLYGYAGFPLLSGWLPMVADVILLVLASQAMGIFMIGVLPTLRLGLSFASLFGVIAFSISGFTYPVPSMDPTLQAITNLFPLRHYFLIYVDQALNGRDIYYSWPQYLMLAAFLILPFLIARNLKKALLYFKYIP
ncbi:ABC transporter permease [Parabacteroides pacaensis]|uniref:ABC transporter permease n=1 Tax=Parabacteroides pacaensis TaxID=2086575 RepID=UPI000D10384F|nr:ABC transporter permease [Parabacteroides pacaensis]